jgi:hypothetical protein
LRSTALPTAFSSQKKTIGPFIDCQLLKDIFPSECPEVNTLVGLFIIALTQSDLSNVSFRLLSLERPKEPEIEIISTEVTEEDKKDAWTDEFGVTIFQGWEEATKMH